MLPIYNLANAIYGAATVDQPRRRPGPSRAYYRQQAKKTAQLKALFEPQFPSRRSTMAKRSKKRKSRGEKQVAAARKLLKMSAGYSRIGGYYSQSRNHAGGGWQELKFKDAAQTVTSTANGVTQALSNGANSQGDMLRIEQNTSESGRIGRKARLRSLEIKFLMKHSGEINITSAAINTLHQTMRMVIAKDRQSNGANPTYDLIFQQVNDGVNPVFDSVFGFRNLENKERFTILHDRRHTLNSKTATVVGGAVEILPVEMTRNIRVNLKGTPVEFSGTTGGIAERRTNNIVMFLFFETAKKTEVSLHSRLRFEG